MDLLTFIRNSKLSTADKALWEDILIPLSKEQFQDYEDEINNDESVLLSMTEEIKTLIQKDQQELIKYSKTL